MQEMALDAVLVITTRCLDQIKGTHCVHWICIQNTFDFIETHSTAVLFSGHLLYVMFLGHFCISVSLKISHFVLQRVRLKHAKSLSRKNLQRK